MHPPSDRRGGMSHVGMWACSELWSCGHAGMWACGLVVLWSCSELWPCGHVAMWSCGHVVSCGLWPRGHAGLWPCTPVVTPVTCQHMRVQALPGACLAVATTLHVHDTLWQPPFMCMAVCGNHFSRCMIGCSNHSSWCMVGCSNHSSCMIGCSNHCADGSGGNVRVWLLGAILA